jgi:HlyD family secretion protein
MTAVGRKDVLCCVVLGSLAVLLLVAWPWRVPAGGPESKDAPAKTLKLPGQVQAAEQVRLFARIVGFVSQVNVDIGDHVKKGQLLAALFVPELEADLKQKQALVTQAEAEILHAKLAVKAAEAMRAVADAQVTQAEATIKHAQANLQRWTAEQERIQKLFEQKTIDAAVRDETVHQVEAAKAGVAEAESKLQAARASREAAAANLDALKAEVQVAEARRQVAAAAVQQQKDMLAYAQILAPFDGVVTERSATAGMLAGPLNSRGERLFTVDRVDIVRVVVEVPETDAPRVQTGARALVEVPALGGQHFEGKVTRTTRALDPKTRTLRAEIDLPNRDGKLLPGMTATVTSKLGQD